MELVTIRLSRLGKDCVVANENGNQFLDLSKVASISKGYNDELELKIAVRKARKKTTTGKQCLLVSEVQTREQIDAKEAPVWIGDGIILYEDNLGKDYEQANQQGQSQHQTMPPPPAGKPLPF